MLGKKRFSFTPSPATKLTFLRNICDNPHLVSLKRGEGSSTLCNAATIFQVGVNDGQQSHFHPQNITLQHTGSLSLQIVTFITKLPCTASRVVTNMKIIFTWPQKILFDIKYSVRIYPDVYTRHSQEQKSGKNTITKYINWWVKLFHSSQASTPNIHGKHKKGKKVHVTTKIKEIEIQQGNIIKFDLFHYSSFSIDLQRQIFIKSGEINEKIRNIFPTT